MADIEYDSALPMRGNVTDGSTTYAENTLLVMAGIDSVNSKYEGISVDASGRQLVVGAIAEGTGAAGNPVLTGGKYTLNGIAAVDTTDAVTLALDAKGRTICVGQIADGSNVDATAFPVLIAGADAAGKVQTLLTTGAGALVVNVGGGTTDSVTFDTELLTKDNPLEVVKLGGAATITRVIVSGSGLMKVELQWGETDSEVTNAVQFNSTANPNVEFVFPNGLDIAVTDSIKVTCTNLENKASPASDFTGYGTIYNEVSV